MRALRPEKDGGRARVASEGKNSSKLVLSKVRKTEEHAFSSELTIRPTLLAVIVCVGWITGYKLARLAVCSITPTSRKDMEKYPTVVAITNSEAGGPAVQPQIKAYILRIANPESVPGQENGHRLIEA